MEPEFFSDLARILFQLSKSTNCRDNQKEILRTTIL
jgi:hypothetical protein